MWLVQQHPVCLYRHASEGSIKRSWGLGVEGQRWRFYICTIQAFWNWKQSIHVHSQTGMHWLIPVCHHSHIPCFPHVQYFSAKVKCLLWGCSFFPCSRLMAIHCFKLQANSFLRSVHVSEGEYCPWERWILFLIYKLGSAIIQHFSKATHYHAFLPQYSPVSFPLSKSTQAAILIPS